ncbi:MAG TPA: RNA polymerase subunit sigma-70 [Clostridiales bacterium]|nr:RNA polymerase subunit sigma-70 [Clostridiales bacterium]HCU56077.1 RNA polymerase subunit sigma-70 [Clostridiales bacterium]
MSLLSNAFCLTGYIEKNNVFPKPLSPEEERACFLAMRENDESAREKLVSHNMRLVVHIAKKYVDALDPSDMISIGSIGLLKAIKTYQFDKGTQFATYAARCIENEILMAIRANKKHKACISLTSVIGADKEGNEIMLVDTLEEPEGDVSVKVERAACAEELHKILAKVLDKREYTIIKYRYGLEGCDVLPQREIAKKLGISRSYISRIESKVLLKLRDYITENNIDL